MKNILEEKDNSLLSFNKKIEYIKNIIVPEGGDCMYGDCLYWITEKPFIREDHECHYGCCVYDNVVQDISSEWDDYRSSLENQSEECIDYIYSLFSREIYISYLKNQNNLK